MKIYFSICAHSHSPDITFHHPLSHSFFLISNPFPSVFILSSKPTLFTRTRSTLIKTTRTSKQQQTYRLCHSFSTRSLLIVCVLCHQNRPLAVSDFFLGKWSTYYLLADRNTRSVAMPCRPCHPCHPCHPFNPCTQLDPRWSDPVYTPPCSFLILSIPLLVSVVRCIFLSFFPLPWHHFRWFHFWLSIDPLALLWLDFGLTLVCLPCRWFGLTLKGGCCWDESHCFFFLDSPMNNPLFLSVMLIFLFWFLSTQTLYMCVCKVSTVG